MRQKKTPLRQDSSGQYYRQIGRKAGVTGQSKFRLGAERGKAELAYLKLGMLWEADRKTGQVRFSLPANTPILFMA